MGQLVDLGAHRPHRTGVALCIHPGCWRWWVSVVPEDAEPNSLECPGCGNRTGRLGWWDADAPLPEQAHGAHP